MSVEISPNSLRLGSVVVAHVNFNSFWQGNAGIFVVAQRKVEILKALRRSTLQKVIQPTLWIKSADFARKRKDEVVAHNNDGSVSLAVDLESADHPSMFVLIILEIRYTIENPDEFFPLVLLRIQLPDIFSGKLSAERHAQHGLNTAEPRCNGRHERDFQLGS